MKLNKLLIGAAALLAGTCAYAQNVSLHGYMDYSNYLVGQDFYQTSKDAEWKQTDPSAEYGSWYNGRTELNLFANTANVDFAVGVRTDASLAGWYQNNPLYYDSTDYTYTLFHQANLKFKVFNDQLNLYTGKFEEWNAGYIFNGYHFGGQKIQDLANRDLGQHFTGVEWIPNMSVANGALVGLRVIAGLPLSPLSSDLADIANVWYSKDEETGDVTSILKAGKIYASYKWLRPNITFNAGFVPGTYYYGHGTGKGNNFQKNYFTEAFFQMDLPSLVPSVKLNFTYDFRIRDAEYKDAYGEPVTKKPTAHYVGISGTTNAIPGVTINFEDRVFYFDDHYITMNEKMIFEQLGFDVSYAINSTPYVAGIGVNGTFAMDANGSGISAIDTKYCGDIGMVTDAMGDFGNNGMFSPLSGAPAKYFSVYAYPYVQKNFGNGYVKTGVEIQYSYFTGKAQTQGFVYRVPVAFCFWY